MRKLFATASAVALISGAAHAGGIDRTRLSYGVLFEKGTYAELSFSNVSPTVSGTYAGALGGGNTGDMAGTYNTMSFAYKRDVSDKLSYGVFLNTPYGANANYAAGPYTGLTAEWKSTQLALILKYSVAPNVSIYGGAKVVQSSATIAIPDALIRGGLAAAGAAGNAQAGAIAALSPAGTLRYTAKASNDLAGGVILGAAYEKPEIAARVGLTYESGFSHKFATTELIPALAANPIFAPSTTTIKMPYALTLDFQSGIAKDTLLFGSVRYSNWSVWEVRPAGYNALTGSEVTGIDNNVLTYQLGIGRRLNENLSVFARATYEKANGGVASRLSPTDGTRSFGIGASYTKDKMKITGGLEYAKLGDAVDGSGTRFSGGKAVGFGITMGFHF